MKPIPIDRALEILDAATAALGTEEIALEDALHRVTAEAVAARCDLPMFDQSAMDGYALRAADSANAPVRLPLADTVAAGPHDEIPGLPVGHACRIFTGGLLPQGADAVIRQEWTESLDGEVLVQRAVAVGHDARARGEELQAGTRLCEAGQRLTPGLIGALAMAGVATVSVYRQPRICVLVSGDEIIDAGQTPRPGEVFNANGPLIGAWLRKKGLPATEISCVKDEPEQVSAALARGFSDFDLIISSGGVSVGDRDLIVPEAEKLGAQRLFWKVAQKPGKPVFVAQKGRALLMGLPGNPASVLVNLAVFVRRVLGRLSGLRDPAPAFHPGRLASAVKADARRETWLRVRTELNAEGQLILHPQGRQASHMLSNLSQATAIARLPASETDIPAGTLLDFADL